MFKRVLAIASGALIFGSALMAQGLVPLVYETKNEWLVDLPAGDFGYGSQVTIVDKATGLVRYFESYEFEGDPIQEPYWQTGGERIVAPVSALSLKLGDYSTELIVPQPLGNKVMTYATTGYLSDSGIRVSGIGPSAALSFPAVPAQNQYEPVLLVQSGLNSPPDQIQHELLSSSGMGSAYDKSSAIEMAAFQRSLTFPALSGSAFGGENALVAIVGGNQLTVRKPVLDGLVLNDEKAFPESGQLIYGDFLHSGAANQLVSYVIGDTNLYLYELLANGDSWELSAPSAYDLGAPIQMATRFVLNGKLAVAVHYSESSQIDIIDLEEEKILDQLTATDQGGAVTAVMSMNGDRLLVLSGKGEVTDRYELFGADGNGGIESLYTGNVPVDGFAAGVTGRRPNVFFFDVSPLASSGARLLGWASGYTNTDWASQASLQYESVLFQSWVDLGADDGLQQNYSSSTFVADGTNVALPNQINLTASVVGLSLSGDERSALFASWSPSPGSYDQLAKIEANFPAGTNLYYRTSDDAVWQVYTSPFFPRSDQVSIDYFIQTEAGYRSPIQTVDYTFTLSAFNRDSNGDGIPDYVQAALGLDPFGPGDFDEDTASDLDELLAQTSATDPSETPAADAVLNRGYYETLRVVSRGLGKSAWRAGSTGYVDRMTGARLGQASVAQASIDAVFEQVPVVFPEGVVAISTEARYFNASDDEVQPSGFEQLMLLPIDTGDVFDIKVTYAGGSVSDAASLWLDALDEYTAGESTIRDVTLSLQDTAFALAMEYALEQEFKSQDYMPLDAQLTLFPNRLGDDRWMSLGEIAASVDESNGEPIFVVDDFWGDLNIGETYDAAQATAIDWVEWTYLCNELYQRYVDLQVAHFTGQGPVDVLRALLRKQAVPTDLVEQLGLDFKTIDGALAEGQGLRDSFVYEDVQLFELIVLDSNSDGCFLAKNAFAQNYSLFDEAGERYVFSKSVDILAGTQVRVQAVERDDFSACSGIALEVRSFQIVAMPELAVSDADGNLLDDNWELFWLGQEDHDPFESIDGSGYSLLQQFLSGHDPADPNDLPEDAIENLGAPEVQIAMTAANQITLTWEWPGAYSDLIRFKLIQSDELGNLSSIQPSTVDYSRIGDSHTLVLGVPEGDRRFFKLVMSL